MWFFLVHYIIYVFAFRLSDFARRFRTVVCALAACVRSRRSAGDKAALLARGVCSSGGDDIKESIIIIIIIMHIQDDIIRLMRRTRYYANKGGELYYPLAIAIYSQETYILDTRLVCLEATSYHRRLFDSKCARLYILYILTHNIQWTVNLTRIHTR